MTGLLWLFVVVFGRKIVRPSTLVGALMVALLIGVTPHSSEILRCFSPDLAVAFAFGLVPADVFF